MAKRMIDYGVDANNDLAMANGDFVREESTAQHQKQLIICSKGEYKGDPTVCVGAFGYLNGEGTNALTQAISSEFSRDGMDVQKVEIDGNGIIQTNAFYK